MADIDISQVEADALIAMEKHRIDDREWLFPAPGERLAIPLTSIDKREQFMLDVSRGQIKLTKATFQNRARQAIILMRLDLNGPPHRNPDGVEVPARTCIFIGRDMGTNGQPQRNLRGIRTHQTCSPR
jgi:hypothetical protein